MNKKLFNDIEKHKKEQKALDIKKQIITSKILEEATSILETFKDFNIEAYKSFIESLGVVTEVKKDNTKEEIIKLKEENETLKAKVASLEVMIKAFNNTKKETINKEKNTEDKEKIKEDIKESKEKVEETQKRKKTRRSKRKENGEDQNKDRTLIELPETLKINFSNLYSYKCEAVDQQERYIRGYYQDVPFSIGIKNSSVMVFDVDHQDVADEIYEELRKAGLVQKRSVCTDPFRVTTSYGIVELATNDTYIGFVIDHNNYITLFTYQEQEGSSKKVACCGLPSFMESKDLFHNCHDKDVNLLAFQLINQHRSTMGLPPIDDTKDKVVEETKENNTKEEINSEDTKEQENTKDDITEETNDNITEETNDEEEWNEEDEWEDWEADEMFRQQVAQSAEEYYKRRADRMEYEEQNEEF